MAKILLAWELGGGLGHIVRFERLIKELRHRGHTVSVAIPYPQNANRLQLGKNNVKTIAEWPGVVRRRRDREGISRITFGDMLADIIFKDADEIIKQITAWRRVFGDTKADIVIADYAPGAVLAARGYSPCNHDNSDAGCLS